jgi:hypothetical protein
MSRKSYLVRFSAEEHAELTARARIEGRSINEIVRSAVREHFEQKPIPREDLLTAVRAIASRDSEILRALKEL